MDLSTLRILFIAFAVLGVALLLIGVIKFRKENKTTKKYRHFISLGVASIVIALSCFIAFCCLIVPVCESCGSRIIDGEAICRNCGYPT